MRQLPNIITLLRIVLIIPIMVLLARQQFAVVLVLFVLAALSDGLDGWLARRFGWQSGLGAVLDPLADKLMLIGCYLVLGWSGLLPLWLAGLVVLRDLVIIAGALGYRWRCGELEMVPSRISKANTVLQMALGLLVIIAAAGLAVPLWLLEGMILVVAASTLWSGINYVLVWSQRARRCREGADA